MKQEQAIYFQIFWPACRKNKETKGVQSKPVIAKSTRLLQTILQNRYSTRYLKMIVSVHHFVFLRNKNFVSDKLQIRKCFVPGNRQYSRPVTCIGKQKCCNSENYFIYVLWHLFFSFKQLQSFSWRLINQNKFFC